jgi:hypothetical protein
MEFVRKTVLVVGGRSAAGVFVIVGGSGCSEVARFSGT